MLKYIFLILLPFNALAQIEYETENTPSGVRIDQQRRTQNKETADELKKHEPTGLEIDSQGKKVGATDEWNYTYIRFAQSNVSFVEKEKGSSLTFGHRQVADSFYYDLQYNTLDTSKSKSKNQSALIGLGWQANWKHRLLPYVGIQAGYSWLKSDKLNFSETGFYTGIDAGVILKRYYPFLFILGTRFGVHNYSSEKVENMTVQEGYLSIAIEVF